MSLWILMLLLVASSSDERTLEGSYRVGPEGRAIVSGSSQGGRLVVSCDAGGAPVTIAFDGRRRTLRAGGSTTFVDVSGDVLVESAREEPAFGTFEFEPRRAGVISGASFCTTKRLPVATLWESPGERRLTFVVRVAGDEPPAELRVWNEDRLVQATRVGEGHDTCFNIEAATRVELQSEGTSGGWTFQVGRVEAPAAKDDLVVLNERFVFQPSFVGEWQYGSLLDHERGMRCSSWIAGDGAAFECRFDGEPLRVDFEPGQEVWTNNAIWILAGQPILAGAKSPKEAAGEPLPSVEVTRFEPDQWKQIRASGAKRPRDPAASFLLFVGVGWSVIGVESAEENGEGLIDISLVDGHRKQIAWSDLPISGPGRLRHSGLIFEDTGRVQIRGADLQR